MASIGPYSFDSFRLRLVPATRPFRLKTRPGVPGTGVLFDEWRAEPVSGPTSVLVSAGAGDALREAYRGLVDQHVLVVDQFGVRWRDVLVMDVRVDISWVLTNQDQVDATWTLLVQSQEPT